MVSSTAPTSEDKFHSGSGFIGLITKLFAPVTNLFRPAVKAVTADESSGSSSSSLQCTENGSALRLRQKKTEQSLDTSRKLSGKVGTVHSNEDKENEDKKVTKHFGDEVNHIKSNRSPEESNLTSNLASDSSTLWLDNLFDKTLQCPTPSEQSRPSINKQTSSICSHSGLSVSVDRWQRRCPSSVRNTLLVSRYLPYSNACTPKGIKTNKERRFTGETNVIDKESKERYRKFLEEAGIFKASVALSGHHARRYSSEKVDCLNLLHRGQSALNLISQNVLSSASTSRQGSVTHTNSDEIILPAPDNRKDKSDKYLGSGIRGISEDWNFGKEDIVVWDAKCRDDFKALWEEEKNTKLLVEHRLAVHRDQAYLRHRRAKELLIEKRLIEEARRDEELNLEEQLRKKLTLTGFVFRSRKVKDEFPELDDEAVLLVKRVWDQKLPVDEKVSGEITRKDLMTLKGRDWLNDEVINSYMNLICERAKNDNSLPKVYAFNTFFYPTLSSKGYASVKRWTRKVDIFAHEIILVPVHLGAHWCLAVIDFTNKLLEYYDSMGGSNDRCLDELSEYICEESLDKRKEEFDFSEWHFINRDDIPQQMNGSDCGMFTCKFAEFASRRAQISFTHQHMPYFRKRMVYEICRQKLL